MSSDFFIAKEDPESYDTVCDIRKKANRTNSNVITAFSGLKCPGEELHVWESEKKDYIRKFKKAKQCLQRRLTKMKEFPARTPANKTSRKKHIYPIQVAYAYGKDCLKKFATKPEQDAFKLSVDKLIDTVSKKQKNVKGYFGKSIEDSIKSRHTSDPIRAILEESYYNKKNQNIIEKQRLIGYNALNEENKEKFFSILNEGFVRNTNLVPFNEENENESVINENLAILKPSKTLKRNFRKRYTAKRKPKPAAPPNIGNINTALAENRFAITNALKKKEIEAKKQELIKLYKEKTYIDEKMYMLEDVFFGSSGKKNKINIETYTNASKLLSIKPSKKASKKAGILLSSLPKYQAAEVRRKLYQDIANTHTHLHSKLNIIVTKLRNIVLDTTDTDILIPLQQFYISNLLDTTINEVDKEIESIPPETLIKLDEQRKYLYSLKKIVSDIDAELLDVEMQINENLFEQQEIQMRINTTNDKLKLKTPKMRKLFEDKVKSLKQKHQLLEKTMLDKYIEKTSNLRDVINEINKKYENILILRDKLYDRKERTAKKPNLIFENK